MIASLDDYRWLISDAARPWLAAASEAHAAGQGSSAGLIARLRRELSAARTHLVLEQAELRQRAREKFALAGRMFFTRKGLEQATDETIADYKAARFSPGQRAADLCSGIGGDSLALARICPVVAVDCDPVASLLAEASARASALDAESFQSERAQAEVFAVSAVAAWHIDPDRRPQGRRTSRVESFQPPLDAIEALLKANRNAAIKLAPAADAPQSWQATAEREWLGSRGECRQQVAWFGSLARHPERRSATIVDAAGGPRTIVGTGLEPIPIAAKLGRYVYEPHSAVLAAKLTGILCQTHSLPAVSPGIAYLTGDSLVADSALAAFEVQDVLPFDQKQLKAWCRDRRIGRLEVKKRGVDVDLEKLRRAILSGGDEERTLIVTPLDGKMRAAFAHRIAGGVSR